MSDEFYKPGLKIAPTTPTPGEFVWSLRKDAHSIRCELRSHGAYGVEAQFFRDGELLYGQRFADRAGAEQLAEEKRRELARGGWCRCAEGWICEQHLDRAWPHDDCIGPGVPCTAPECPHRSDPPKLPAGWQSIARVDDTNGD